MDLIEVRGIVAHGKHGANPGERDQVQRFEVDLKLELDLSPGERSDDLQQTVDYSSLQAVVTRIVGEHSFTLLERLAGEILDEIFHDPRIAQAELRVAKPAILHGATPSVTLRRANPRATSKTD